MSWEDAPGWQDAPAPRTLGQNLVRGAQMIGRGVVGGVGPAALGAPFGPVGAAVASMAVPAADTYGKVYNWLVDHGPAWLDKGHVPILSEVISKQLDKLYPHPENMPERMLEAGAGAAASAGAGIATAGRMAQTATNPVVRGVAETMAQAPQTQMAAAPVAGATSQYVGEKTGNPALGIAAGMVAGGAAGFRPGQRPQIPTRDDVANMSHAAYAAAERAGVVVHGQDVQNTVQGIAARLHHEGYDAVLHPRVAQALSRLSQAGPNNLTLNEVEVLRRVARNAAASPDDGEARLGEMVIDGIDNLVEGLGPHNVAAGDPQTAVPALMQARELWRRNRQAGTIEVAVERARNAVGANYSAAGMQTAVRQQLRRIVDNPQRLASFSPEDQVQLHSIVRGGPIENTLRFVGKFAPSSAIGSLVSGAAGYSAGAMAGGHGALGTAVVPAIGFAAREGATAIGRGKVARLQDSILTGGAVPRTPQPTYAPQAAVQASVQAPNWTEDRRRQALALAVLGR